MTLNASGISPITPPSSVPEFAWGKYTGDGSGAITVALGFSPSYVKIWDETDNFMVEWNAGLAATHTVKTTIASPSVTTLDTGSLITSNHILSTNTVTAQYLPSGNGAGEGTLGPTSVTVDSPDLTIAKLIFATGLNTSSSLYSWIAQA